MESVPSAWRADDCRGFSEPDLLRYRSNLLGRDPRITNFGGGNTSVKIEMDDPLSREPVEVLWVKGSGGDLGSVELDGFATLYLDKLRSLRKLYRGCEHEDEMVALLAHCAFGLNPRPASIDTPLHAFVRGRHVDHVHPDSVVAIAAAKDGEALTREIFGGRIGWLPWQRPGFDLGLRLSEKCTAEPELDGVVLGGHGLMTWADTSEDCYRTTLRAINQASEFLAARAAEGDPPFGGQSVAPLSDTRRRALLARVLPMLRGKLSREQRKVAHFVDEASVLEFVGSARAAELAAIGTSCPDHFLRTKIRPLLLDRAPDVDTLSERSDGLLAAYRESYAAYYDRCKRADSPPMRDPYPVVVLLPGIGVLTFAKDKPTARQAGEFYVNAIHVMRGAELCGGYRGLSEQEAFDIEYWALEEAKLRRMPPEKMLSRRVAVITGAAGGIGKAVARRFLRECACVVLTDLDAERLAAARDELAEEFSDDFVRGVPADVTDEDSVRALYERAVLEYGGLDVVVCCAGLASAAPFEDTSLELWQRNLDVLTSGYFLAAREGFKVLRQQGLGGSIVFVGSKNALVASPQASAYATAKAACLHLARGIALEGATHGIRVNTVNPDAVLRGSAIWSGEWRRQRAASYGIEESSLEEHYRQRSLLKLSVLPEDVAEAVLFFASDLSAKSTANILNVDAGHPGAFPR